MRAEEADGRAPGGHSYERRRYAEALQCYQKLEHLQPSDAAWSRRVADCYRRLGRPQDELNALVRAAEGYVRTGFLAQAAALYRLAVVLGPTRAELRQRFLELNASRETGLTGPRRSGTPRWYSSPSQMPQAVGLLGSRAAAHARPMVDDYSPAARLVDEYDLIDFDDTDLGD